LVNYFKKKIFTKEECDRILSMPTESIREKDLIKSLGLDFETSWANGTAHSKWDENYEKVLHTEDWVMDRLEKYRNNFSLHSNGYWPLLIKTYDVGDQLGIHQDGSKGIRRTAISVNLNEDFEGGRFQIFDWDLDYSGVEEIHKPTYGIKTFEPESGLMIQVPLYVPHGVTPVIKGARKQLLTWTIGDKLKW
tara:strand:- start:104 stop:679 length:576 start_codon:yes stop_codon:yes gene_type:complete